LCSNLKSSNYSPTFHCLQLLWFVLNNETTYTQWIVHRFASVIFIRAIPFHSLSVVFTQILALSRVVALCDVSILSSQLLSQKCRQESQTDLFDFCSVEETKTLFCEVCGKVQTCSTVFLCNNWAYGCYQYFCLVYY